MMKMLRKLSLVSLFVLQALYILQTGCTGITGLNPAGPPAPVAEIPANLQIPGDISINVDTVATDAAAPLVSFLALSPQMPGTKLLTSGNCGNGLLDMGEQCDDGNITAGDGCSATCQVENFRLDIAFSANLVFLTNNRLRALLGPLSTFLIPVDENLTEMEQIIFIGDQGYIARLNFADFDLDGQNGTEGCSGNTLGLPICMRIWLDDGLTETRLFAARFDEYPLPENSGAGSLRGVDLTFSGVGGPSRISADYDHLDIEDRFTDSYSGFIFDPEAENPDLLLPIRAFASQLGPEPTALKTSNGSFTDNTVEPPPYGFGFGRWFEDNDYWLGSFESNDPPRQFSNQCVRISTGEGVSSEEFCDPLGLNTDGLEFLPFATASDVIFYDFPPSAP